VPSWLCSCATPINPSIRAKSHAKVDASVGAVQRDLENLSKVDSPFGTQSQSGFLCRQTETLHISRDARPGEQDSWLSSVFCGQHCTLYETRSLAFVDGSCTGGRDGAERRRSSGCWEATLEEVPISGSLQSRRASGVHQPDVYSVAGIQVETAAGIIF